MRHPLVLLCSAAMNVVLAALLLLAQRQTALESRRVARRLRPPPPSRQDSSPVAWPKATRATSSPPELAALWRLLDTGDIQELIRRLHEVGAPDPVIQDIAVGAINRRFAPQILALRREPWRYWEPVQRRKLDGASDTLLRERQARDLELQRNQLVQSLLGVDWASVEADVTGRPDPLEKLTMQFSEQARPRARQVIDTYDQAEREVIRGAGGTLGWPERAELNRLYQAKVTELGQILSPAELEDYEVRASPVAEDLKQVVLVGFEPTEEEFRTIFRIRKVVDTEMAEPGQDFADPAVRARSWQAQSDIEEALREALGEKRYAEYSRCQDYTFRGLIELTDQYDLPSDAASQVHDIREATLREVRALKQDPRLDARNRDTALQQIRSAAEESIRSRLGEAAYARYTQLQIGGWIEHLGEP